MTKFGKFILFIGVIFLLAFLVFLLQRQPKLSEAPVLGDPIIENQLPTEYDTTLVEGNAEDLIYLSILPKSTMPEGILSYRGAVKGGYFFEGNILINILDINNNLLKASNAVATTEWMTLGGVEFEGNIDFTGLPAGLAYFEIHNDNPSGMPENDKFIRIPIMLQ